MTHYPHLLDPTRYPDYDRRSFRVPTWSTFDHRTQFAALRSLHQSTWLQDLVRYTEEFKLGRVIWPMSHVLYMPHIEEMVEEIRKRKLFLFDLWSYVPGSSMEGMWSNITPPQGMITYLERTLGERFLGMDNGEQDGRYVAGYAGQQCPNIQDRRAQYLNFIRHFERMCNELGNHMSALVSLNFGHYFLKEGHHGLLGAETAQGLPNSQVYYAFIRGACRQYGVHWFGNASTFNRWGYKNYEFEGVTPDAEGQSACGPDQGTSLSLLKRLLYSHILYNSVLVGFEMGWIREVKSAGQSRWELTPIGMIQQGAIRFVEEQGSPGVLHTPVALLLDFYAGWTVPRHLYSGDVYKVWGGMPYEEGDYLTHGVLGLIYPGYEDSSYFHDERGFMTPTPHGDMADVVLSDSAPWTLRQYGLVVAAGALTPSAELGDTVREFLRGGGHLVVTGENARMLFPEFNLGAGRIPIEAGARVIWADGGEDSESQAFDLLPVQTPSEGEVLARCGAHPAVIRYAVGDGICTVLLSPWGMNRTGGWEEPIRSAEDRPLASPYSLLAHVQRAMKRALTEQQLFEVGEGLGFITCRKGVGDYTVGVFNPGLDAKPLRLVSRCGRVATLREIELDQREKGQVGYWPTGMGAHDGGVSAGDSIAGGDIRIFAVQVEKERIRCLPEIPSEPRPHNRFLSIRGLDSVQEALLRRPTFFRHFDGVKLDWRYVAVRDRRQIDRERVWLARRRVRLVVDFSADVNFYPGLTLLNQLPDRYAESREAMDDALDKAARLGATDAVMTLHRQPENHCSAEQAAALFEETMRAICRQAGNRGMTVHLQYHRHRWWGFRWWNGPFDGAAKTVLAFVERVQAPNLRVGLNTGHAVWIEESLPQVVAALGSRLGMILYSAPSRDKLGQTYDAHAPIAGSGLDVSAVRGLTEIPQVLDALYADGDAEYRDVRAVWL